MKGSPLVKVISFSAVAVFLIAFLCGLIGRVSFGMILLRGVVFAAVAAGLAALIHFVFTKFLGVDAELIFGDDETDASDADDEIDLQIDKKEFASVDANSGTASGVAANAPDAIGGDINIFANKVASAQELGADLNADYDMAMNNLDSMAEEFANLEEGKGGIKINTKMGGSSSMLEGDSGSINSHIFSGDVTLQDIGGDSTPQDYANAIKTMLKK